MEKTPKEINRMLFTATLNDDVQGVEESLDLGADPNIKNELGLTPLHFSVHKGQVEIMKSLIKRGADLNAKAIGDWTPLHEAVSIGNRNALRFLLENGADVNATTKFSSFPMTMVANN